MVRKSINMIALLRRSLMVIGAVMLAESAAGSASGRDSALQQDDLRDSELLSERKYSYFRGEWMVEFGLRPAKGINAVTGELLVIRSNDNIPRAILVDWDKADGTTLFFYAGHKYQKFSLEGVSLDRYNKVSIHLDFRRDLITAVIDRDTAVIRGADLSIDNGYTFSLLPVLSQPAAYGAEPTFSIEDLSIVADNIQTTNAFYWYLFIIAADIVIFMALYLHRRRRGDEEEGSDELLDTKMLGKTELPRVSAIYIFGGLKIFDRRGEEISHKLSPLLKELLCLLIVHTDRGGISSAKLKELLWPDMSPDSARNNRAVYFRKLRILFKDVGEADIKSDGEYWKLETTDTFVDYLWFKEVMRRSDILAGEDIGTVISISGNGNILPEADYLWLDSVKDEVSNQIIDQLLLFAESDAVRNNAGAYFIISEAISRLERLNEDSLVLRCKAYSLSGRHQSARNAYDRFCREYKSVYGETFSIPFADILK